MQNNLKPKRSKLEIAKDQEIFKMKTRLSDIKLDFKGKSENFACNIYENEDETQKHTIECPLINKERKLYTKPQEYEELYKRNIQSPFENCKAFLRKYEDKEKIKKLKRYQPGCLDHVTGWIFHVCILYLLFAPRSTSVE